MTKYFNRAQMTTTTTGTGTVTLGSASSGYNTFATAGVANNDVVNYLIKDGTAWEIGIGTYTTAGTTLSRALVESSTGSLLNLSGAATVAIIIDANAFNRIPLSVPAGRLTPTTGTPVISTGVTGQTTIYYTPYNGNTVPIPDAAGNWNTRTFTELSQTTTDNTKSPAACGAFACYDMFVWDDAGTLRCTRGPAWTQAQTFTVTIASPAVFSLTSHGFYEGQPLVFSTTGALPTGLTAGTVYYVISAGLTANAFEVSTSVGGSAVNTSGSQSGTHTATQNLTVRGTGAGTSQLTRNTNGFYTNTVAITNGPGAGLGVYVGTICTNSSSQVDYIIGGTGAAGGESTFLGVWNMYNRVRTKLVNFDNTNSWNYTSLTYRIKNNNPNNRISFVVGLKEISVNARSSIVVANSTSNIGRSTALAVNSMVSWALGYSSTGYCNGGGGGEGALSVAMASYMPAIGLSYVCPLESSGATGTCTWYGDNGATAGTDFKEVACFFVDIDA